MSNKHFLLPRTLEQTTTEYHKRNMIYTMNILYTMSIINTTNDQILHDCPQNTIIYTQSIHTCRHLQSCYMYEFVLNIITNSEIMSNIHAINTCSLNTNNTMHKIQIRLPVYTDNIELSVATYKIQSNYKNNYYELSWHNITNRQEIHINHWEITLGETTNQPPHCVPPSCTEPQCQTPEVPATTSTT